MLRGLFVISASICFVFIAGGPARSAGSSPSSSGASASGTAAASAAPAAAAAPANTITGGFGGVIHTRHPTVYVISLAPDVPTSTAIAVETAMYLRKYLSGSYLPRDPNYDPFYAQECNNFNAATNQQGTCYPSYDSTALPLKTWLIPQPTWAVQDFINQCMSDPSDTVGAIVIDAVENDNGALNYVGWSNYYYRLFGDAFFVTCEPHSRDAFESNGTTSSVAGKAALTSGTRTTSVQITQSAQSKSWQKTVTVAPPSPSTSVVTTSSLSKGKKPQPTSQQVTVNPYPPPKAHLVSTPSATMSWAHARPATATTTAIANAAVPLPTPTPSMSVIWEADANKDGHSIEGHSYSSGGVPLLTIAGVAGYYASRTKTITTSAPQGCGGTSGVNCTTTQITEPSIAPGFALLATSLSGIGAITVPGVNSTQVLKRAASNLAQSVYNELAEACSENTVSGPNRTFSDPDMDWMCRRVFNFP